MNRRQFLIITFTSLAGLAMTRLPGLPVSSTASCQYKSKFYKGTASKIYESTDGRTTWTQAAEFGSACRVRRIAERGGLLIAEIGLGRNAFTVESSDGRVWYSRSYNQAAV